MDEADFFRPRRVAFVPREGVCPACGRWTDNGRFVRHHWFEPDDTQWEIYVCVVCNAVLSSRIPIALGDHTFPSWEAQVEYIKKWQSLPLEAVPEKCSILSLSPEQWEAWIPASIRRDELSLLRSWLARSHSKREVQSFGISEEEMVERVTRRVAELESRLVEVR